MRTKKLPEEVNNLAQYTDIPFHGKWVHGYPFLLCFWRCYESRYKGHVIKYYEGGRIGDFDSDGYLRNRLKLFHRRPLNLGLQCYYKIRQIGSLEVGLGQDRNVFASKVRTPCGGVKCYAAEKGLAEVLFSQGRIIEAFVKLRDITGRLCSGALLLFDDGVSILADDAPDERVLEAMHNLSTALTESTLLPAQRTYRTLNVGFVLGSIIFLLALTLLIILTGGDFSWVLY